MLEHLNRSIGLTRARGMFPCLCRQFQVLRHLNILLDCGTLLLKPSQYRQGGYGDLISVHGKTCVLKV